MARAAHLSVTKKRYPNVLADERRVAAVWAGTPVRTVGVRRHEIDDEFCNLGEDLIVFIVWHCRFLREASVVSYEEQQICQLDLSRCDMLAAIGVQTIRLRANHAFALGAERSKETSPKSREFSMPTSYGGVQEEVAARLGARAREVSLLLLPLELAEFADLQEHAVGGEHVDEPGAVDEFEVGLALGGLDGGC